MPCSEEDARQTAKQLVYCVVVDDYVEHAEDILNELVKKTEANVVSDLRKSLSRFRKSQNKDYYYDDICVFSPHDFIEFLNQFVV